MKRKFACAVGLLAASASPLLAQSWVAVDPAPEARSRAGGAIVGDTFYLIGGEATGGVRDALCFKLDIATGTWDFIAPMPDVGVGFGGVSNTDCAAIGTDIYQVGGWTSTGVPPTETRVLRYDTTTDEWEVIDTDPFPTTTEGVYANALAAVGGKLYVIGGQHDTTMFTSRTYVYDPDAAAGTRWTEVTAAPTPRRYHSAAVIDGRIYISGGLGAATTDELLTVDVYDPATDTWDTLDDTLSVGRGGPASYNLNGNLYVASGGWASYHTSGEVYDGTSFGPGESVNFGMRTIAHAGNENWLVKAGGWSGTFRADTEVLEVGTVCYADCDGSGQLDFFDFLCFQNEFSAGSAYADCDGSGQLDFFDFLCFQNEFSAGCP